MSFVSWYLWVRFILGFPWLRCWIWLLSLLSYLVLETISSAWWEWTFLHFMRLHGSAFSYTIEIWPLDAIAKCVCVDVPFYLILYLMMDGYTFCILFGLMNLTRCCNYFYVVYSFSPSQPVTCTVDEGALWLMPSGIQNDCLLFKWIHTCTLFFDEDLLYLI